MGFWDNVFPAPCDLSCTHVLKKANGLASLKFVILLGFAPLGTPRLGPAWLGLVVSLRLELISNRLASELAWAHTHSARSHYGCGSAVYIQRHPACFWHRAAALSMHHMLTQRRQGKGVILFGSVAGGKRSETMETNRRPGCEPIPNERITNEPKKNTLLVYAGRQVFAATESSKPRPLGNQPLF